MGNEQDQPAPYSGNTEESLEEYLNRIIIAGPDEVKRQIETLFNRDWKKERRTKEYRRMVQRVYRLSRLFPEIYNDVVERRRIRDTGENRD